jgi:hypothetical protein
MSLRVAAVLLGAFALVSCGVKQGLERPMEQIVRSQNAPAQDSRKDPSLPPRPLGEPGSTTPPYTTGP